MDLRAISHACLLASKVWDKDGKVDVRDFFPAARVLWEPATPEEMAAKIDAAFSAN